MADSRSTGSTVVPQFHRKKDSFNMARIQIPTDYKNNSNKNTITQQDTDT